MSSDINVQTFSGKVNITNNLLVGSSHLFVDTNNNKVGLVTADPHAGLHVNSNAYVDTDFRVGSSIIMNDIAGQITAGSFVGNGSGLTSLNSDSGSWVNGTNSNIHLTVSTDKVGIGVTDPDSKLEVRGNIRASFSDTDHGMFIDAGGTILRDFGGNGAGFHFTTDAIWPTNYLGSFSAGEIDLGSSSYRWNNIYTEDLNASGTVTASTFSGDLSGNASTATTLQTARNINGVLFDGSSDINVITTSTIGVSATSGENAGVTATNKANGLGVDLAFTLPQGPAGPAGVVAAGGTVNRILPYSSTYAKGYNSAAIEVREYNLEGAAGGTEWERAPRIGFHWGGRVASQIICESNGRISIVNNPGTAYEAFNAGSIYTSGTIEADGRIYADNGCHVRGDWLRVNGQNGIYFESYGGGWHMTDTTWVRAYNGRSVYSPGAFYCDGNRSVIRGSSPTLYLRDTDHRSGMIHMNGNRMYFLSGGVDSESWAVTANGRWPLELLTDTNQAVFGGNIDGYNIKLNNASVANYSTGNGAILTLGNRRSNSSYLWDIYSYSIYYTFGGGFHTDLLRFNLNGVSRAQISDQGDYTDQYFTGQHGIYITDVNHKNIDNHVGLIVSATNNKYTTTNGKTKSTGKDAITINDAHPVCSLSRVERDKACFGVVSNSEDFDNDTREYTKGVFASIEEKDDTLTWINSLGEGSIWVTNMNGNLESGDYITTSSVPGYGMKQDSEFLANYTVAKITMDCDFNPLISIKQVVKTHVVPVEKYVKRILTETNEDDLDVTKIAKNITQYVYGDDTIDIDAYNALNDEEKQNYSEQNVTKYYNVETRTLTPKEFKEQDEPDGYTLENTEEVKPMIDENGHIMWMDDPSGTLEPAYNVRYLLPDGTQIPEAEYTTKALANKEVYIAAFVGCTYHCG